MISADKPMNHCTYCGRENDVQARFCLGCGTPLGREEAKSQDEGDLAASRLTAGRANFILLVYLAGSLEQGSSCAWL